MDYAKAYEALISRAKHRVIKGYSESHHILPKCMGGTNNPDNLVRLTPEEHFVAHQLLVKMHPGIRGLVYALVAMCMDRDGVRLNNKLFGWVRRKYGKIMGDSKRGKPRPKWIMEKMWNRNKGCSHTEEHKQKIRAALKGRKKTSEHVAKVSAALKGRNSSGMSGRKHLPESIEKIRASAKKRKHTEATKQKIRDHLGAMTQEQRSAMAIKAWQTKRLKAENRS
jgi:hypothetical protein